MEKRERDPRTRVEEVEENAWGRDSSSLGAFSGALVFFSAEEGRESLGRELGDAGCWYGLLTGGWHGRLTDG